MTEFEPGSFGMATAAADPVRVLQDQVVIVTGASSGMGAASAVALAGEGARVVVVGRDQYRLGAVCDAIGASGGVAVSAVADFLEIGQAGVPVDVANDAFGRIDALVHCAGIFDAQPFSVASADNLERQWAVNVRAPYLMTQAALPHLSQGSSVLFFTSTTAHVGFPGCAAYSGTKGALEAMARSLAIELAPKVRVNILAPGFVQTPMLFVQTEHNPDLEPALVAKTPLGFIGEAQDIANAVVFLSSSRSRYVTGSTLIVDGGWTAQR
jgi:NAD(P)-dependent dehydrogenase (short-subunit alcohol dehydrogenase family)